MVNNNFNSHKNQSSFLAQDFEQLSIEEKAKANWLAFIKKSEKLIVIIKKDIREELVEKFKIINENYYSYSKYLKNIADEFNDLFKEVSVLIKNLVREMFSIGELIRYKSYELADKLIEKTEKKFEKLNKKYSDLKKMVKYFNLNSITQDNNANNKKEIKTNKDFNNEIDYVNSEEIKKNYDNLYEKVNKLLGKIKKKIKILREKSNIINENYYSYFKDLKNAADEFDDLLKEVRALVKNLVREMLSIGGFIRCKNYEMAEKLIKKAEKTYRRLNKNFTDLKNISENF